jgi:hypothetical protein
MTPVLFYGHTSGEFKAFSNFYYAEFYLDGVQWACSEQAYMYAKSDDPTYRRKIKKTQNPFEVKALGRKVELRPNWDNLKYWIMIRVIKAKFSQNADLKDLLISTGDRSIHEDCKDPWWGGGPNFPSGRDLLGKALMEVRAILRKEDAEGAEGVAIA